MLADTSSRNPSGKSSQVRPLIADSTSRRSDAMVRGVRSSCGSSGSAVGLPSYAEIYSYLCARLQVAVLPVKTAYTVWAAYIYGYARPHTPIDRIV